MSQAGTSGGGVTAIPVPVSQGGTGDTSLTAHGVLMGEGTSPINASSAGTSGQVFTSGGASADGAYSSSPVIFRAIVTHAADYTLALTDAGTFQKCTKGTTQTITVPTNATIAFATGTEIDFFQQGAGQVVFAAAGGVTIQSAFSDLKVAVQFAGASLKYLGSDIWSLVGDLSA